MAEDMEVDVDTALERQSKQEVSAMETDQQQPHKSSTTDSSKKKEFKENKDGIKREDALKKSGFKKSFRGLLDSRKKAKDLAGNWAPVNR